jgi:hypothetical protein
MSYFLSFEMVREKEIEAVGDGEELVMGRSWRWAAGDGEEWKI